MKPCCFGDVNNIQSFVTMFLWVGARQALQGVRSFASHHCHHHHHHHHQKGMFQPNHVKGPLERRRNVAFFTSSTRLLYTPTAWPENLYREWTLEQDQLLWSHLQEKNKSPSELAVLLGRGVRGVERRIEKLSDVNSSAYQRLFVEGNDNDNDNDNDKDNEKNKDGIDRSSSTKPKKLVPSSEVLRRIEWDYQLDERDFFVLHYDRVENTIVTSPLTAPNEGINSGETSLIKALPEHRIVAIAYKERVVWDRRNNRKHDLFFGTPGIVNIMESYEDWKGTRDRQLREQELLRQAWEERWVAILGSEARRDELVRLTEDVVGETNNNNSNNNTNDYYYYYYSSNVANKNKNKNKNNNHPSVGIGDPSDDTLTPTLTKDQQQRVDSYLHTTFELFRQISEESRGDPETSTTRNEILIPLLDEWSEWIASTCWSSSLGDESFDDDDDNKTTEATILREMVLRKLSSTMDKLEGKKNQNKKNKKNKKTATTATTTPVAKASSTGGGTKKERARFEKNQRNNHQSSSSLKKTMLPLQQLLMKEEDLEETFVRGSGAGGQKINKTSNRVVLVHLPTGIRVECQETRTLSLNRKIGRKRLLEKLDAHFHGTDSKLERKQQKMQQKKRKSKAKNKARLAEKQERKKQEKLKRLLLLREQEEEAADDDDDDDELFLN